MISRTESARAFTLIELLLVVAILAVISVMAVPEFVKSTRGNRLRAAARTVVASGRYARSMALMRQAPMGVTFDLDAGRVTVEEAGASALPEPDTEDEDGAEDETVNPYDKLAGAGAAEVKRDRLEPVVRLLDRVRLAAVEADDDESSITEGRYTVVYGTHGRCRPYRVTVEDEFGVSLTVSVDHLAAAEVSR